MAGKSSSKVQTHPKKQFCIPADLQPLGKYATTLINTMRETYKHRMGTASKRKK